MIKNYTLKKRQDNIVKLALAYSRAMQVIDTKQIKKIVLINN
jgi:hypothetical protein